MSKLHAVLVVGLITSVPGCVFAATPPADSAQARQEAAHLDALPPVTPPRGVHVDHSGRNQRGKASIYAHRFGNRKMANGRKMKPDANVAASKTLPLGSVAKVTNLGNGKTAIVKVEDRGPFVDGRVMDVAPKVAGALDFKKQGVVPVEVKPITVPQPDGTIKLGAGAADASPQEVRQATKASRELAKTEAADR